LQRPNYCNHPTSAEGFGDGRHRIVGYLHLHAVDATAANFKLREVSADKGYGSLSNYKAIANHGAVPYIAFKSIHTGKSGGLWAKMFHYFQYRREEFLSHYHKRSNVESVFSMIKAKFRDHVRSKSDVAMVNEVLCKIICHNICCLIQETHELGIDTAFWEAA
jgi:transposase